MGPKVCPECYQLFAVVPHASRRKTCPECSVYNRSARQRAYAKAYRDRRAASRPSKVHLSRPGVQYAAAQDLYAAIKARQARKKEAALAGCVTSRTTTVQEATP